MSETKGKKNEGERIIKAQEPPYDEQRHREEVRELLSRQLAISVLNEIRALGER